MRVLHVQRTEGVSGSERHLLALLPGLARRGHDVRMLVLEAPGGERFTAEMVEAGVPAAGVALRRSGTVTSARAIDDDVRRFRPDILHTHLPHADVLGAVVATARRVALVSTVHSTAVHYRREPHRLVTAVAGHRAHRLIAISHHVARFAAGRRLAAPSRIRTVHYGIDLDAWRPHPAPERARRSLGWPADATVALLASRLVPDKGHDVAIRAFALALERAPSLWLAVAGDGPLRAPLEQLAADLGVTERVAFLGYVADVRSSMAAADVVVFPTGEGFGEGFGLVNLEAMALGRPVIGSAVASIPEIVDDGRTGLLVPPGDVAGFADALVSLTADPARRRAFGAAARRRAEEHFSLEAMVDATVAVYDEVVAGRS